MMCLSDLQDLDQLKYDVGELKDLLGHCAEKGGLRDDGAQRYVDVSENSGTPKSSNLIGFSIIFTIHFGVPLFGNTHV